MAQEVLLQAEHLQKTFKAGKGRVQAITDVSLTINRGETLALVGESGCGKSTLGRLLLRLIEPDSGKVTMDQTDVTALNKHELREFRKRMQLVFQDPYASLDPRFTVEKIISEPLKAYGMSKEEQHQVVLELAGKVGINPDYLNRYPHQFSGGQRQRIAIARALITRPRFVVADEPVSALDVSIQAQVLNLLMSLQDELGLSYLFISHDLNVVRHISNRVGVMYLGRIVETGDTEEVYTHPLHPYTQALLSAIPRRDPSEPKTRIHLQGDVPSPANPPSGCPFHNRCPQCMGICKETMPQAKDMGGGHLVSCHLFD